MEIVSHPSLSPPPEGHSVELIYDSLKQRRSLAQLPRTHLDKMMEAHIHPTDAERLINQFNWVSFPIMRDDRFMDILKNVVTIAPSEYFEERLKQRLDIDESELERRFRSVGEGILAQVFARALSDLQRSDIINLIGLQSLHDAKSFVVSILPVMVEGFKKEKSSETNTDQPLVNRETADGKSRVKSLTPPSSESLPSSLPLLRNLRRSLRIAAQQNSTTQGI